MNNKERQIDIQNLKKHQEFHALKLELEDFCNKMDNINDIDLSDPKRVGLDVEIFGRQWASKKVRDLLSSLGLVDKLFTRGDRTYE